MSDRKIFSALVIALSLGWAGTAQAQTYFYIDQIAVSPAAPTEQDNVQIQLIGNLSSTGSSVTSASADVNGFTVDLTLVTQNTIGLDVLVPHTESIHLGLLSAGTYTVNIAGAGVYDGAPSDEHVFVVSGAIGSPCDSLEINGINWAPFSDTALVLYVSNPSATVIDYPGFLLLSDNGDTLARETVNLFGIGPESIHTLGIPTGTSMPASPFNATLQLWTDFFEEQVCTWDLNAALCPPDSCTTMLVQIVNYGGGIAVGSFTYTVLASGIPISSGSLTLTSDQQSDQDSVCLQAGNYELQLLPQQEPTGGQVVYGVLDLQGIQGPFEAVGPSGQDELAFSFYGPCIEVVQSVSENTDARLLVSLEGGWTTLIRSDGKALGELRVMDAEGRLILISSEPADRHQFHTAGWSPGLYLLQARKTDGHVLTVRFIIG